MNQDIKILRQKSTTTAPHRHSFAQLSYTLEGILHIQAQNKIFVVPPNTAIYIPQQTIHQNKTHKNVNITTLYFGKKYQKLLFNDVRLIQLTELIKNIINKICVVALEELSTPKGKRLIATLMDEIVTSESIHNTELTVTEHPLIIKLYEIFRKTKSIYPSIEQAAKLIHVSPRTLLRIFKKETGMSFIIWKQRYLFIKAIELLKKYHRTSLVADRLGYKSDSAFISMFKKMSGGQTPSDFF